MRFEEIVQIFHAKPSGNSWAATCPAHDDRRPSLSIAPGLDGRTLVKCHAGCDLAEVLRAAGLSQSDLFDGSYEGNSRRNNKNRFDSAQDATDAVARTLGIPTHRWDYVNEDNEAVGVILRWDTDDGKEIRPIAKHGTAWRIGAMPDPRPLYNLTQLGSAQLILVVEGESCCDMAAQLGFVATTSAGGAKAASKTDWRPLSRKTVILVPDNDRAGEEYGDEIIHIIFQHSPNSTIKLLELPKLPPGGDLVDFVTARRHAGVSDSSIRDEINTLIETASAVGNNNVPKVLPWVEFPVDALPPSIQGFVSELARATSTDPSFAALAALVTAAGCLGNRVAVIVREGWTEPAVLWGALIARSGATKSPVLRAVVRPLIEIYKKERLAFEARCEEFQKQRLRHDAEMAAWKSKTKKGDIGEPPTPPTAPIEARTVVSDTTVEKLAVLLEENPLGLLLARDELSAWLGSFDRYATSGGSDLPTWLSFYAAESVLIDRKCNVNNIFIERGAVSILGTIQPGTARRVFETPQRESGLLARFLLASPPERFAPFSDVGLSLPAVERWKNTLEYLLSISPENDDDGFPQPRFLPIAAKARSLWGRWHDELEKERLGSTDDDLAAHLAKLKGQCLRIALVIAAIESTNAHAPPRHIDELSLSRAVSITDWFRHEIARIYRMLNENDKTAGQRQLVETIARRGGSISVRDVQRSSRTFTSAASALGALQDLVDAGCGHWHCAPPDTGGGRPAKVFVLGDSALPANIEPVATDDKTPEEVVNKGGFVSVDSVGGDELSDDQSGNGTWNSNCESSATAAIDEEWGEV